LLGIAVEDWRSTHPQLASWAQDNLIEGFTIFSFPIEHQIRLRTTNGLERLNREIKRRTKVASLFQNTGSCLRLISALLVEQDEEWLNTSIYLNMKH
jgi:transposase-like protein